MTITCAPSSEPIREERTQRRELAALYRLIAHFRMTDLISTHISLRVPGADHHFLINPYGLLFEEITASSLVKIDLDGRPVEPTPHPVNPAGFVIHSAVHAAREDAQCVVHVHTRAGCAVAAQRDGLLPVSQMALEFYGRVAYHDYEGLAFNLAERDRLVADLGEHPVMILRNHGLLAVGSTVAEAFWRIFYLQRACEIQVEAQGAELVAPPPEVCELAGRQLRGEDTGDLRDDMAVQLTWNAMLRLVDRIGPDYVD
jgi:ribulose-5-phosphate 4-epimerase/fuculose-1-phosphate aldolase